MNTLRINGETHNLPEGTTVAGMLALWKLAPERVVVELNGVILKKASYEEIILQANDRVEIVQFVGGG